MAAPQIQWLKELDIDATKEEVEDYAEFVGIDLEYERDMLDLAREGLLAPLPDGWQAFKRTDAPDNIYYWHSATGTSTAHNPNDALCRQMVIEAREQRRLKMITLTLAVDDKQWVVGTSMEGEEVVRVEFADDDTFGDVEENIQEELGKKDLTVLVFVKPDASQLGYSARAHSVTAILL